MRDILALVILLLSCSVSGASLEDEFLEWCAVHEKYYAGPVEFQTRFLVWRSNLDFINRHNARPDCTFFLGMNEFGDLPWTEFEGRYMGFSPPSSPSEEEEQDLQGLEGLEALEGSYPAIDWRERGAVTPVRRQGPCGACWAFGATGAWEGAYKIATGQLIDFSEQQLLDCVPSGCRGGTVKRALNYWVQNEGPCRDSEYRYTARQGKKCKKCPSLRKPRGHRTVPYGNENALERFLQDGPVAVALDASDPSFQFYRSGIFSGPCNRTLNHVVLVVGRSSSNPQANQERQEHWILKNSWHRGWGINGYMHMAKGRNLCGIANFALQPLF